MASGRARRPVSPRSASSPSSITTTSESRIRATSQHFSRPSIPIVRSAPENPALRAQAHFWEDWADEALSWFEVYLRFMYPDAHERSVELLAEGRPKLERMMLVVATKRMYRKELTAQGLGRMEPRQVEAKFLGHIDALETLLTGQRWLVGAGCQA